MTRVGWTLADIRRANRRRGFFFFSPDTIKGFDSRPSPIVHEGTGLIYFVDNIKNYDGTARVFHVRPFDPDTCRVLSQVGAFDTEEEAHECAAQQARQ